MNTTGRYAFAGYVADVFQIASFRFSNPHSLMKFFQIDSLRKKTGATQFIEAGTYLGLTAERDPNEVPHHDGQAEGVIEDDAHDSLSR